MANEPTFNPNAYRDSHGDRAAQPRGAGSLRAGLDLQGRHRVGGDRREGDAARHDDRHQPRRRSRSAARVDHRRRGHNYGVLSFTDVIVKSSNVGAIKIGFSVGAERLSRYVARFGFGRPVSPDFPGESPGIVWSPAKWTDSALASVSMGYQVGVTPLQMVAAVSSVANGGELRRAARRPRGLSRRPSATPVAAEGRAPHDQRRHRGDADRRSWKRSSSDGTGEARADCRLHRRRQDRHRAQADQRPLLARPTTTCRSSASCRRAIRRSRSSS